MYHIQIRISTEETYSYFFQQNSHSVFVLKERQNYNQIDALGFNTFDFMVHSGVNMKDSF